MKTIAYPDISGSVEQQLASIRRYLWLENEYMQTLAQAATPQQIWSGAMTAVTQADNPRETESKRAEYKALRALIIKTADEVTVSSEQFRLKLSGMYLAKSQFGDYFENASVTIDGTPYGIRQLYTYTTQVKGQLEDYVSSTEGYIRTGILDNSGANPVLGVEVGILSDELECDGQTVTVSNPICTRITPDSWELWRHGVRIAYTDAGNVCFPSAHITGGSISIGDKCHIDQDGTAVFTDGIFSGSVTAGDGNIGGFQIAPRQLYYGQPGQEDSVYMSPGSLTPMSIGGSGNIPGWAFAASDSFGVTKTGQVWASDIRITGGSLAIGENCRINSDGSVMFRGQGLWLGTAENPQACSVSGSPVTDRWVIMTPKFGVTMDGVTYATAISGRSETGVTTDYICVRDYFVEPEGLSLYVDNGMVFSIFSESQQNRQSMYLSGGYVLMSGSVEMAGNMIVAGNIQGTSSGSVVSDSREKNSIQPLAGKYERLFDALQPVSFRYSSGSSGRLHTGFIAQQVEQARQVAGLTDTDFAAVVKTNMGTDRERLGLRYEELIALAVDKIQKIDSRVKALEERV